MMWNRRSLLAIAPLAVLVACAPDASYSEAEATAADAMKMDRAAVGAALDAVEDAYIAAYNAGDAAGIAALFAADGSMAPPETPSLDVAGIEAAYAASFASGPGMVLEVMREDFIVGDGMVAAWGAYTVTAPPDGGDPIVTSGRYGNVSRFEPDGSLKIFRHMYNYEVPPPAGE